MPSPSPLSTRRVLASLALIATLGAGAGAAFAYTAGWLSPGRLTPQRVLDALDGPAGPTPGYRRNHAKGICFTGLFESNGAGQTISRAALFTSGQYPALGRFNLGTTDPTAADGAVRVRGIGLQIVGPHGATWRSAMINAPVFAVATPQGFHDLQVAAHSDTPGAMAAFAQRHPEFHAFASWAASAPWTGSYAETAFNSLDSFIFSDADGRDHAVRWSLLPVAPVTDITRGDLEALGPNHLEQEIATRVAAAPQRWRLVVTLANDGDQTADPTQAWPEGRRTLEVGTLVVQRIEAERDGPCRDITFDPTILPDGMRVSDDPLPAARSAAYARSYNLRTAEADQYPHHLPAAPEPAR